MHSSEFVREIIVNELVELYPGSSLDNSANPKEDFINFLSQRMNFSKEEKERKEYQRPLASEKSGMDW